MESPGKSEAPEFTRQLSSQDVKEGRPIKFDCAVKGIPQPEITWFVNGQPIDGGIRFHTEQRKGCVDVSYSLTIDNTEVEDSGEIKVVAVNKAGETETVAKLTIEEKREPPKVVRKLENVEVVEKEKIVLKAEISGKPKPTITWVRGDTEVKEEEGIHFETENQFYCLIINNAKVTDAALYTLRARNAGGQISTDCRVKVLPGRKPSFAWKMSDTLVPQDAPVKFECKVKGVPAPAVKWFINDQEIEEGEGIHFIFNKRKRTHSLILDKARPEMQGLMKAVASNSGGEMLCTAELTVRGRAPTFVEAPMKCTFVESFGERLTESLMTHRLKNSSTPYTGGQYSTIKNLDTDSMLWKFLYEQEMFTTNYIIDVLLKESLIFLSLDGGATYEEVNEMLLTSEIDFSQILQRR